MPYIIYDGIHMSLGALQREYIPEVIKYVNDPRVSEGVLLRAPVTLEEEYQWYDGLLDRKHAGTDYVFAIFLRGGTPESPAYTYIGHTGLHKISQRDSRATTGTLIFKTEWFKKNIGTEAKLWLQYHAFRVLGLRKLTSEVKAFNARSLGHLIKCGYRIVGRRKEQHFHNGRWVDEVLLEVFREDWEPIWAKYQETKEPPHLTPEQRELVEKETDS